MRVRGEGRGLTQMLSQPCACETESVLMGRACCQCIPLTKDQRVRGASRFGHLSIRVEGVARWQVSQAQNPLGGPDATLPPASLRPHPQDDWQQVSTS